MYIPPVLPGGHGWESIFIDYGFGRVKGGELWSFLLRGRSKGWHGIRAILLVHRSRVYRWCGWRSGMRLSVGVVRVRVWWRCTIWLRIWGCRVALDALVASRTTAGAAASTAFKATACQLGAAAYAARDARNDGEQNEASDDDSDNDWPPVVL